MVLIQFIIFTMLFPLYLDGIFLVLRGLYFPDQYLDKKRKWEQKFWQPSQRIRKYLILSIPFIFAIQYAQLPILWLLWAIFLLTAAAINLLKLKKPQVFAVSIIKKKQKPSVIRIMLVSWLILRILLFAIWSYAWKHLFLG